MFGVGEQDLCNARTDLDNHCPARLVLADGAVTRSDDDARDIISGWDRFLHRDLCIDGVLSGKDAVTGWHGVRDAIHVEDEFLVRRHSGTRDLTDLELTAIGWRGRWRLRQCWSFG